MTPLLVKMMELGAPLPLLDVYYDLSYGRAPQVLLIIDIPPDVHHLLQVSLAYAAFHSQSSFLSITYSESRPMADAKSSIVQD